MAFLTIGIASAVATAVIVKAVDALNKYGKDIGISATKGTTFLGLTWGCDCSHAASLDTVHCTVLCWKAASYQDLRREAVLGDSPDVRWLLADSSVRATSFLVYGNRLL